MTAQKHNKSLMRCLGEFVGHIMHSVKNDNSSTEVNREVQEKCEGNITLRRTTIDEIELRAEEPKSD